MKFTLPLLLLGLFGLAVAERENARPAASADVTNLTTPLTARKTARMAMDDSQVCPGDVSYNFSQNLFLDITLPIDRGPSCAKLVRLSLVFFSEGGPYKITFANGSPAPTLLPATIESSNVTNPVVKLGRGSTIVTISPVSNPERSCTYTITVVDDIAPIVDAPSAVYAKTTAVMPDLRNLLSVEESCDYTVAQVPAPGSAIVGSLASIPVNFTVTDASDNQTPASLTLYFQATTPYDNLGLTMPSVCTAFDLEATLTNLPTTPSECFTIAYQLNDNPNGGKSDCANNGTLNLSLGLKLPGPVSGLNTLTILSITQDGQSTFFVNKTVTATVGVPLPGTPTVAGAPVCAGQNVQVNFSVACPDAGTYSAQLSNASGSFASPVNLGAVTPDSPTSVLIPQNTPFGIGYRIRVVSSTPDVVSPPSASFTVNALGNPTVALYPATPSRICLGDELPVTFSTTGACPFPFSNVFTVQLSSSTGSFASPTTLGPATPGTTSFVLPPNLSAGTGYRVRILSSNPVQTSFASAPFELRYPSLSGLTPGVGGVPQGGLCRGSQVTLSFNLPAGSCAFPGGNVFTAQLSSASGSFASPVSLGVVQAGVPNALTIPVGSAAGTGYRIRVVSSVPASTSLASVPFRVNATGCNSRLSAEEPELVISPNPVTGGEIRLRVLGMDDPAFSLTTSVGRSVGISVKTDGSGEFVLTPRQALTPGIYVVGASEGTTRITRRVLVTE